MCLHCDDEKISGSIRVYSVMTRSVSICVYIVMRSGSICVYIVMMRSGSMCVYIVMRK